MIVGTISTRFAGLDGVSLEAAKVAQALAADGYESVWFAGELGNGFAPGSVMESAHFDSAANAELEDACFGRAPYGPGMREAISARADILEAALDRFVGEFAVDVMLIHNALSIPMQLPLGVALARYLARTRLPAVGFHHDFGWEKPRFGRSSISDLIDATFPPVLPNLGHVVINRLARTELRSRRGVPATVVPNVMDFANPPPADGGADYRARAGIAAADLLLLQPTRVIPRKGIELTLELAAALDDPRIKVVVSHPDDRDPDYWARLQRLADDLAVDLRLAPAGDDAATLAGAYAAADVVCFPSLAEGFGNAFVEAMYFGKPIFVNRYPVYVSDLAPTGVIAAEIDGAIDLAAVDGVAGWLSDPAAAQRVAAGNYEVGLQHFSYDVVRRRLGPLLAG